MGAGISFIIKKTSPKVSAQVQAMTINPKADHIMVDNAKAEVLLRQYVTSTEEISELETRDPLRMFYIKTSHIKKVEKAIKAQLEVVEFIWGRHNECEPSSSGGIREKKSVQNYFLELGDKKPSKEDHELLAGRNKLEIAMTQLEMFHQEKAMTQKDVYILQCILSELRDCYVLQDDALEQLCLKNLSPEENRLQEQLANLARKRIKLCDVYQRWKQGREFVGEACRHFSTAVHNGKGIKDDDHDYFQLFGPVILYVKFQEIQDDLLTALQYVTISQFFIQTNFPYCSEMEVDIMEEELAYLFSDMNAHFSRFHAEDVYIDFQKRIVALYAWINMTIHSVIEPELKKINHEFNEGIKNLGEIRKKVFESRFPDVAWKDANILPAVESIPTYSLPDLESERIFNEFDVKQLAPLPSREELFGEMKYPTKSRLINYVSKRVHWDQSVDHSPEKIINNGKKYCLVPQSSLNAEDMLGYNIYM